MTQPTAEHNPFMLLVHPEAVFAAMEKSERLGSLNRHLCRPLDRQVSPQAAAATDADNDCTADGDLSDVLTTQEPTFS
ncbi:MAG: hypothetical protein JNL85_16470 [Rubrivivax sp.]|nr:hypothetical protein [Rubrivivax sp.]